MKPEEIIAVVTAFKEGKQIEYKFCGEAEWDTCPAPSWDFFTFDYRVKPEAPKRPREWWVNVYADCSPCVHRSKSKADESAQLRRLECVHVREVLPPKVRRFQRAGSPWSSIKYLEIGADGKATNHFTDGTSSVTPISLDEAIECVEAGMWIELEVP
jgi:hypothetical protein